MNAGLDEASAEARSMFEEVSRILGKLEADQKSEKPRTAEKLDRLNDLRSAIERLEWAIEGLHADTWFRLVNDGDEEVLGLPEHAEDTTPCVPLAVSEMKQLANALVPELLRQKRRGASSQYRRDEACVGLALVFEKHRKAAPRGGRYAFISAALNAAGARVPKQDRVAQLIKAHTRSDG